MLIKLRDFYKEYMTCHRPINIYQVGVSTVDITPPVGIYLAGYAARQEPSTEVYHPLKTTAVGDRRRSDTAAYCRCRDSGFLRAHGRSEKQN